MIQSSRRAPPALEGRQIGAGVGFGEVLEGHLLRLQDGGQQVALLFLRPPHQQGGENVGVGEVGHHPGPLELFVEDGLMLPAQAAPAVLLGVGGVEPALGGQYLVHLAPELVMLFRQVQPVHRGAHVVGDVLSQPGPHLLSKRFLLRRIMILEVHENPSSLRRNATGQAESRPARSICSKRKYSPPALPLSTFGTARRGIFCAGKVSPP